MRFTKALVIIAAAALAAVSLAQPFGGGQGRRGMFGGGMYSPSMLLMRRDVQDDLKLTTDQKAKLQSIGQEMMEKFRQVRENNQGDREAAQKAMATLMADVQKQTKDVLTADQQKRIKEIGIQMFGNVVVFNEDFQKDLALTEDQIAKLKALQAKQRDATMAIMQKMRDGEIEASDMPALFKKNQDVMKTEIDKVLTDAQKTKLKEMTGQPFTRTDDQPAGGGN